MAENEKDVPIKERDDGSVLAKLEDHVDHFPEEEKQEVTVDVEDSNQDDDDTKEAAEGGEVDSDLEETDEDRERIREARREERRLKKELVKQKDATARNKISALERRNAELAERLAKLENTAASYQFAQIDKAIEDEATRVEYAKMKMLQAAQENDAAAQVEYLEQLTDAKQRLQQAQYYKKQRIEQAKAPKQNVPTPIAEEVQRNATQWLKKNSWYDPQARGYG